MAESDPTTTQRENVLGIEDELAAEGLIDPTEIGRGGFGVVYRCRQAHLDRAVAVKVLSLDLGTADYERFLREQRAMGRLSGHPNITDILEVGILGSGRPYLVMPYHRGGSLEDQVRKSGPLPLREVLRIGVKLAGALETAHRIGIVHRDVKPGNILRSRYGEPQLTDFGTARISGAFETSSDLITASPAFAAPEILQGATPTPAADVYSLAATLFCLLTGHAAYTLDTGERLVTRFLRMTSEPVPDLRKEGIPDDVAAIIERAMSVDPRQRPQTALEFGTLLARAQADNGFDVDEMSLSAPEPPGAEMEEPPATGCTLREAALLEPTISAPRTTSDVPPTIATKVQPPSSTHPLLPRPELLDRITAQPRKTLTVIHGPAGFGKSTLATQWMDALTAEGTPVAWLTVDAQDNHVVWFLADLLAAIRRVRPDLGVGLRQHLDEHAEDGERFVLGSLVNQIHSSDEPLGLVIDDWQQVNDPATIGALTTLLEAGCRHLNVLVTSRTTADLPLSALRMRDQLTEIDATAMSFSIEEAQRFLVDVAGLRLDAPDVERLWRSTDGWVAGLQLASLSLRDHPRPASLIANISGRHRTIGQYFVDTVLDSLLPETLDFMMATSIPDRVCGDLASALTGNPRGGTLLEELESRNLFVQHLDDDGVWYRYHPLFSEFLRRRLERDDPDSVAELHRTASNWFAAHGLRGEAVDEALRAGDAEHAVDLVERDGLHLIEHARITTLLGLVAKLPSDLVALRPRLQLDLAWANLAVHRGAAVIAALDLVDAALADGDLDPSDAADIAAEAKVMRRMTSVFADVIEDPAERLADDFAEQPDCRPFLVSTASLVDSFVEIHSFDFTAARRRQRWAHRYHALTGSPFNMMYGRCLAGIAAFQQLDIAVAEDEFRTAHTLSVDSAGPDSLPARLSGALLGEVLYKQDRLDEAAPLFDAARAVGAEGAMVDVLLATYGTGARLAAVRDNAQAAREWLRDGSAIASELSLPRLSAHLCLEGLRLGLTDDEPWIPPGMKHGIAETTVGLAEEYAIRMLLRQGDHERAAQRARAVVESIDGLRRPRAAMHARLLLVTCLAEAGARTEAARALVLPLAACADLHVPRPVIDEGAPVTTAIEVLLSDPELADARGESGPNVVQFAASLTH
ncbi:serine/threonine-protein kinase [Nocardia higoensis]|uniref:serine/threonine-protein kinase n=1 Tax=Nocardia higoensis TaxID=228599 RepID=UPI000308EC02|nr:serine/threonine-protein kinase [Nocardia higoensis]